MAWDVPWFVGGGANHGPDIARVLGHYATNAVDGVLNKEDCKVVPLDVPGGGVKVLPGLVACVSRTPASPYQSYIGRLPSAETVDVNPTGSGGGRIDAVVARVEDPWVTGGSEWPNPVDPTVGPYMRTRVIEDIAQYVANPLTNVQKLHDLGQGWTGTLLAFINIPVSTGTITSSMIIDARALTKPNTGDDDSTQEPGEDSNETPTPAYARWPNNIQWTTKIPSWANRGTFSIRGYGIYVGGSGSFTGDGYLQITSGANTITTPAYKMAAQWAGVIFSISIGGSATISIPAAMRGKTCTVQSFARKLTGTGGAKAVLGSRFDFNAKYSEVPE